MSFIQLHWYDACAMLLNILCKDRIHDFGGKLTSPIAENTRNAFKEMIIGGDKNYKDQIYKGGLKEYDIVQYLLSLFQLQSSQICKTNSSLCSESNECSETDQNCNPNPCNESYCNDFKCFDEWCSPSCDIIINVIDDEYGNYLYDTPETGDGNSDGDG